MTDKELRKLNRAELLELLVDQAGEMDQLREQLEEARRALEERTALMKKAGSMAEAALGLNGVFEAADRAARDYLDNAMAQREALLAQTQAECRQMRAKTQAECDRLRASTRKQCEELVKQVARAAVRSARQEEQA